MDEGSALLHHLERSLNQCITCIVTHRTITPPVLSPNAKDAICLTGTDTQLLEQVQGRLKGIMSSWGHCPNFCPPVQFGEDNDGSFYEAKHIAICVDARSINSSHVLCYIGHTYRKVRLRKGNIVLLLFDPSESDNSSRSAKQVICDDLLESNPELRVLNEKCRVHRVHSMELSREDEDVIRLWVQGKLSNDSDNLNHVEYSDLSKIFVRDLRQCLPDMEVFVRLFIMCLLGLLSVLGTLLLIVLIIKEPDVSKDVEHAQEYLQHYIQQQRSGKFEWGQQYNAIALTALQISSPSWCFDSVDRQRSVDRMEISLLAAFSRLNQPSERELTPMQLAYYINALWATYQNPRHFHDHNLLAILDKYLSQVSPYVEYNGFAHSMSLVALCNTGFPIRHRYWERLVEQQRPDGSFPLGIDETAMVVLALSCATNTTYIQLDVDNIVRKAVTYLAVNRHKDGSYGSVYTTALVLQAFTASGRGPMDGSEHEQTMSWLTWQAHRSPLVKNIDIAAHVLIALSGKTLLSIKSPTDSTKLMLTKPPSKAGPPMGKQTGSYKYLSPDPKPGAVGVLPDPKAGAPGTQAKVVKKKAQINDDDVLIQFVDIEPEAEPETIETDKKFEESLYEKQLKEEMENETKSPKTETETETKDGFKYNLNEEVNHVKAAERKHIRRNKGKAFIKKGHMEFGSGRVIDIEELIAEDMEEEGEEEEDVVREYPHHHQDTSKQTNEEKKKVRKSKRRACSCRTMNIYHPLYVLLNMCPVIPTGCP